MDKFLVISLIQVVASQESNPYAGVFDLNRLAYKVEDINTCIKCEAQCDRNSIMECQYPENRDSMVCKERLACCLGQNFISFLEHEECQHGCQTSWSELSDGMRMVHRGCSEVKKYGRQPKLTHCRADEGECIDICRCNNEQFCNNPTNFSDCKPVLTEATVRLTHHEFVKKL